MDEVDIDGEDFNELEARLYGQIHHEAADVTTAEVVNNVAITQSDRNDQGKEVVERIVTARSVVNRPANASRVPDSRYWVKGLKTNANNSANPNKNAINSERPPTNVDSVAKVADKQSNVVVAKNVAENQTSNNDEISLNQSQKKQQDKIETEGNIGTELLLNPAAIAKNANNKFNKKKKFKANQPHVPRSGPFMQQENKLQKARLVKAKKQKSKKVRDKNRKGILKANETIVLDSSTDDCNESGAENSIDDDDVVLIPTKPPPLITLSDSENDEEDEQNVQTSIPQLEEENAMDASDVIIDGKAKINNFTKPTEVRSNATEKRTEQISSRCTSPSSVQSSDDFIGQSDRCRLLADNGMADDQDLALLTADVDSLMQAPSSIGQVKNTKKKTTITTKSSNDVKCTTQFTTPITDLKAITKVTPKTNVVDKPNNYRVDQAEFRALDVYESESDINESVYSKGGNARATTIINAAGSSSEADDVQQAPKTLKVKRLMKRRTSSNNRTSDTNNVEASTDEDDDDDDEDNYGVAKTSIPYIMRGTAVERCNKNIRKRTQSLSSRRSSAGGVSNAKGTLSDKEFIATLNSLVQGHTTISAAVDANENDQLSDNDVGEQNYENNVVIEQQINEKNSGADPDKDNDDHELPQSTTNQSMKCEPDTASIASVEVIERPPPPEYLSEAVPDQVMAGLDKIFESIDNLVECTTTTSKKSTNYDNSSSDDDIEVIQPPVTTTTTSEAVWDKHKYDLPIRNIVYSERGSQSGGIGWNDEMHKFYNHSWNGEHFTLVGIQNGMERDRNLWKIYSEDRFPKKRPYSNLKCYNCCELGHTRAKCMRPKKPLICYMCGESGHLEPRCPNTICLRCGNKTQVFTRSCNACTFQNRLICPICKVRGHAINLCPDKWRRYHSTTQPNAYPNSQIEFNRRKMCCVCGGFGHFSDTCRSPARFMDYPVIVSQVKSHQKSYDDILFKTPRIGIAFNLLYRPGESVVFHMSEKTLQNGYYERFLKAVNLCHLLNRKRPCNRLEESETPSKQAKPSFKGHYKPNPYGNIARSNAQTTSNETVEEEQESAPNQVPEVSGSVSAEDIVANENKSNDDSNENIPIEQELANSASEFKTPNEVSAATTTSTSTHNKDILPMDSDSNYSFSDHFELPDTEDVDEEKDMSLDDQPSTSAAAAAAIAASSSATTKRVREMEPLPDFIPLNDNSDTNTSDLVNNFDTQTGISRRFVADDTDDENEAMNPVQEPVEVPCEAKIYLTHFHSNYLLSPDGHNFLVNKSKECNIKARLDWTSVGHVLVIFGLPEQQDIFHKALLEKCRELMDQMNNKQLSAIKVPKRIDALIRFLRDNISQLQSDLGDVNDLQRRIKNLEKTHTKANMKLAEKCRRLLNMILLGQAGLGDGDRHLEKLLQNLKSLINDYQAENMVPQSLREEIDSHTKLIFTSYRHDNYNELIQTYNNLAKNQKQNKVNIDPLLLGHKMLDTTLTAEQRARLEQPAAAAAMTSAQQTTQVATTTPTSNKNNNNNSPFNTPNTTKSKMSNKQNRLSNTSPQSQNPSTTVTNIKTKLNTSMKKQNMGAPPPFANPQQKSTVVTKFQENIQQQQYGFSGVVEMQGPSKGPSVFWSRESMRYLDECLQMAESNMELLQKLKRIQSKSFEGALSYNDYRAVIKLHGAMVGN